MLSLPTPPVEAMVDRAQAIDLARVANDGMAELVRRYPDRFPTFAAALPLNDPDASVKEIRRAVDELGARGFQICSNVQGKPITADEFLPLFETMAAYDLPDLVAPVSRGRSPTTRRSSDRSSRSGGRSDGRTKPAWRWRASCSRACSIGGRTSRSSRTTWAPWRRSSPAESAPGGTSSVRARPMKISPST